MLSGAGEGSVPRRREFVSALVLFSNLYFVSSLLWFSFQYFQNFHQPSRTLFQSISFNIRSINSGRRRRSFPATLFQPQALPTFPLAKLLSPDRPPYVFRSESNRRLLLSTTNPTSVLKTLCSMSTPFFFPPATKVSTLIIYSSLHSRHTITYPQKLGFHLMGLFFNFGPTTIKKLPNIRSDGSSPPTARPTWIDFCHGSPLFLNVTVILLIVLKIGPTFKNSMKDIKSAPPTFLWLWQNLCCRIASLECYTPGFTFIESKFNQPSIVSTFQIRIQLPYQELQLRSLKSHSSTVYQILSDLEGLHKHCPSNSTTLMLHISVSVGHGHHPNRGATSICWFGRYHCQEGHSHQISSTTGNVLGPLRASFLLRLSRTRDIAFFCAELTFGRKGLWRKSCSILEGFSAQPSSLVERTVSCLLGFSK